MIVRAIVVLSEQRVWVLEKGQVDPYSPFLMIDVNALLNRHVLHRVLDGPGRELAGFLTSDALGAVGAAE